MKKLNKILTALVAAAVSAGATGSIAYAKNGGRSTEAPKKSVKTAADSDTGSRKANGENAYKDETVYVLCNSDSSVKNVVVSDWLKNSPAMVNISDISDLSNIVNVKGDESFELNGEELTWEAEGSDIYYKGNSDKDLPVDVAMEYFLDGKKMAPEDIKGKSGHLVIRWTYKNNEKVTKNIGGENKELYVPFMAASAAVLSTDKYINVEVTNGKVISDGSKLIVVGMAFPGLGDSLALDKIEGMSIEVPESFEVSADVTDFEMNTSVTVVSNEIFSQLDVDNAADFGDLKDKLKELSDGAEKLSDGTAALYDGIKKLSGGTGDLTDGIDKLLAGSLELKNGASDLDSGAKKITDGAKTLSDSTGTFASGLGSAKDGSAKLKDGLGQVSSGASDLSKGLGSAKEGSAALVGGFSQVTAGADALSSGLKDAKAGSDALTAGFRQVDEGAAALNAGAGTLSGGVGALTDGSKQVKDGSAQLSQGAAALSDGAAQLSTSAGQLSEGITSAKAGADSLSEGIGSAKTGADQLTEGAAALSEGASQLSAGITQAGASLDTTIAANEQALAALQALYQQAPSQELAVAIGTLQQTIDGQKQISASMAEGGQLSAGAASVQAGAQQLSGGLGQLSAGLDTAQKGASALQGVSALWTRAERLSPQAHSSSRALPHSFLRAPQTLTQAQLPWIQALALSQAAALSSSAVWTPS
jgi:putative membrane protein